MSIVGNSIGSDYVTEANLASTKVLRNTYALLSMTLLFSASLAVTTATANLPAPGLVLTLIGYFVLLFATHKTKDSAWGLLSVFALTGFMGYTIGPMIGHYWSAAPSIVMQALAGTGLVFISLSSYVLITKKDFSALRGFLFVGILVAFLAGLAGIFFEVAALSLVVSAMFVLLMSGLILYETSNIIKGGETNYIMATVTLYVAILNLFTSLLHMLGFAQSDQ
jgi:modulator of FtsH protease